MSSKIHLKLSEHDTKPPISSPNEHQWMGRTKHPSVISHSMKHLSETLLRDLAPFLVVCSSKLNQVSWSWTELLRVQHYSVFLCQLDNVTKSILLEFADDTKEAEEGGRGDRWGTLQRDLDSLHKQANKNCRSLCRDEALHPQCNNAKQQHRLLHWSSAISTP